MNPDERSNVFIPLAVIRNEVTFVSLERALRNFLAQLDTLEKLEAKRKAEQQPGTSRAFYMAWLDRVYTALPEEATTSNQRRFYAGLEGIKKYILNWPSERLQDSDVEVIVARKQVAEEALAELTG